MARIHITDLNSSDSELIDELTAEELLAINGGWLSLIIYATSKVVDYLSR
jgi:hypothetical protein